MGFLNKIFSMHFLTQAVDAVYGTDTYDILYGHNGLNSVPDRVAQQTTTPTVGGDISAYLPWIIAGGLGFMIYTGSHRRY